jgi:NTE family protein
MSRPSIGLALGSGAARGWAHIGILEGLAEMGIAPDIVCGTSMGALVGAAFCGGRLPALKSRVTGLGLREIAALLDLHFAGGGLIEGRRIETFLADIGITGDIQTLSLGFGAVATDLATGAEVWFRDGPLGPAVRASIGMPGVFNPFRDPSESRWLIDGGLVNPVPVSLARALGADIVIAVDLNGGLLGRRFRRDTEDHGRLRADDLLEPLPAPLREKLGPLAARLLSPGTASPSYFDVLANALNIMQDRITRARLAGEPPDVLLSPDLGGLRWLDFHRAADAIAEGRATVARCAVMLQPSRVSAQ